MKPQTVAVLGASPKPQRYSNKAVRSLVNHGHRVIPVAPRGGQVEGLEVLTGLGQIGEQVDTLTLYVGPHYSGALIPEIVALNPGRVILNPGTESAELAAALDQAGIPHLEACTLVLLTTGQF